MRAGTIDSTVFGWGHPGRTTSLILSFLLSIPVFLFQTPMPANAAGDVTGMGAETGTAVKTDVLADFEINEVQQISNDATSGTFTLSFDGAGPTAAIAFNAAAGVVEAELEGLATITDVTVTGSNPWTVEFVYPGPRDLPLLTSDDTLLLNGVDPATTTITEQTTGRSAPIDPAGIAYLAHKNTLLISDSEIEEEPDLYDGVNLWEIDLGATTVVAMGQDEPTPIEPTGLDYNGANHHVYVSNDITRLIMDLDPGTDGLYGTGDDARTYFDTTDYPGIFGDPTDPEDVAWDSADGRIWVANGVEGNIVPVSPGPDGLFDGVDDVVGTPIDVSAWVTDVEGIAYRAVSDTLLLTNYLGPDSVVEIAKDGRLVREIDISGITTRPADVAVAPASAGGDDNLYIVDREQDNGVSEPPPRDGMLFEISAPFTNLKPFVDAGPQQAIAITDPLTITGDTYDDGQPTPGGLTVTWTQIAGPGTATIDSPSSLTTDVSFDTVGGTDNPYVLQLEVSDGALSNTDTVEVKVFAAAPPNQAPTVEAGNDLQVVRPNAAQLNGSVSDDGLPGGPLTITWSKASGPGSVNFANASKAQTTATFSAAGTYVLELTANDGELEENDIVTVTVLPPEPNEAPVVDAGPNRTIDLGKSASLNGSVTDDGLPDDNLTSSWSKKSGPGSVNFADASKAQTTATFSAAGTYTLKLTASDGDLSASDTMSVTVNATPPPPVDDDPFIDDDGNTFENDIEWIAAEGITKGCNPPKNDRYCPDDFVTRGQMAAFLHRGLDDILSPTANVDFIDDNGNTFENDIEWLGGTGVTKGCNPPKNDRYCPDDFVTRGQMAAFLRRALDN